MSTRADPSGPRQEASVSHRTARPVLWRVQGLLLPGIPGLSSETRLRVQTTQPGRDSHARSRPAGPHDRAQRLADASPCEAPWGGRSQRPGWGSRAQAASAAGRRGGREARPRGQPLGRRARGLRVLRAEAGGHGPGAERGSGPPRRVPTSSRADRLPESRLRGASPQIPRAGAVVWPEDAGRPCRGQCAHELSCPEFAVLEIHVSFPKGGSSPRKGLSPPPIWQHGVGAPNAKRPSRFTSPSSPAHGAVAREHKPCDFLLRVRLPSA